MNSFVTRMARLFSSAPREIVAESEEIINGLTAYYQIGQFDRQLPANLTLDGLNSRDVLTLGLFDGVDDNASEQHVFRSDNPKEWAEFVHAFENMDKDDPVKLKLAITKYHGERKCSVYDEELFGKFLSELGMSDFLVMLDELIENGSFCFEYQEGNVSLVGERLAFVSLGHTPLYKARTGLNDNATEQGKFTSCNDLICKHLLPTDFDLAGNDLDAKPLQPLLRKAAMLYALCFLFDYLTLSEEGTLHYKLNGYKTLTGDIDIASIGEADISEQSGLKYLEVFKWLYNGGNLTDKTTIARNIISLNITDDKKLFLRDGVIDAIDSNYRIYERENVRQYIGIRNKVSEQLRNYQKDIIKIYDDFEQDFKKITFSFLTFAFTTAIIRILAKNMDDAIIIPNTIILLLLGFCSMSCFYYVYASWERNEKVKLFDKQYNDMRRLYSELLSKKELDELFADEKNIDGTYRAFIKERTYRYDWLWISFNVIFAGILLYIKYCMNS